MSRTLWYKYYYMIQTSVITQKGQITIPYFIRQKLALAPGMRISFHLDNDTVRLSSLPSFFDFRGSVKLKKEFNIKKMRREVKKNLVKRYGKNS